MPYVVKRGKVDSGEQIFDVGQEVPEELVDETMLEAGSVELLTAKQLEALAESDLRRRSNKQLLALCRERGIEAAHKRMNKDELVALLEATPQGQPPTSGEDTGGGSDEDTSGTSGEDTGGSSDEDARGSEGSGGE